MSPPPFHTPPWESSPLQEGCQLVSKTSHGRASLELGLQQRRVAAVSPLHRPSQAALIRKHQARGADQARVSASDPPHDRCGAVQSSTTPTHRGGDRVVLA
jgi:hypothetical protein